MNWKIQLSELNYGSEERYAVERVLESEWLTMGNLCSEFEQRFQQYIGHKNSGIFVSSATAGLHLILMSLGVTSGDEIILPALTFVSDANVVMQLGATPIFVDSNSILDFNASEDAIIDSITTRTKAIVIVHFAGFPMDIQKLSEVAKSKNIPIIEDCAHAPGAALNGLKCGNLADYSFFSFFSNKNLAIGEGGMVFSQDLKAAEVIRRMRSHGITVPTLERHKGRAFSYDVKTIGLNYRPDEIRASLGIEQLKKLDSGNAVRKDLFDRYVYNLLGSKVDVAFSFDNAGLESSYHIMPTILPASCDRTSIINKLKNSGIQTSIHYPSFSSFSAYSGHVETANLSISQQICARELTLPLHPRMLMSDVDFVTSHLLRAIK